MKITRRTFMKRCAGAGATLLLPCTSFCAVQQKEGQRVPAYAGPAKSGRLADSIKQAYSIFGTCELCPRRCGVNRLKGEQGFCRAPLKAVVASYHPHFGEEAPLVGRNGSGTIFFSNCNLRCSFCQNWDISHEGKGKEISDEELADIMLRLQAVGCHNINLVTPTHVMPNILAATLIAYNKGLRLPLVYNTSGYERMEIVNLLDGVVDIYLPDLKYMDSDKAATYSAGASDYPEKAKKAILDMHRQVGQLAIDSNGIAVRGLIIRHLVMPNRVSGTDKFVKWVAENLPKSTYVNIMGQYRPEYKAHLFPEIARSLTRAEHLEAIEWARQQGLTNLDS